MIEFESDIYADYIKRGEIAVVDPGTPPISGSGVLVTMNNEHIIMMYENIGRPYLHAIKGKLTITVDEEPDCNIIGPVIWIAAGRAG